MNALAFAYNCSFTLYISYQTLLPWNTFCPFYVTLHQSGQNPPAPQEEAQSEFNTFRVPHIYTLNTYISCTM